MRKAEELDPLSGLEEGSYLGGSIGKETQGCPPKDPIARGPALWENTAKHSFLVSIESRAVGKTLPKPQ